MNKSDIPYHSGEADLKTHIITKPERIKLQIPKPVVAAICYRRKNDQVEFLLVRTKGGRRWTFPKGHVETKRSELPWVAAKREAKEEAGVGGLIDKKPFTSYSYSKGKHSAEDNVAAFLMAVESQCKPDEPERDPKWFTPKDAVTKLAKGGREEKYMQEHKRVIKAALTRIQS
jgi:8-oxo-dGTP pyrophosphatase MutT (NUDIX family)